MLYVLHLTAPLMYTCVTYVGEILEYLQNMEVNEAVRLDMEGRDRIGSQYVYIVCWVYGRLVMEWSEASTVCWVYGRYMCN